jgi:hypothetical protein
MQQQHQIRLLNFPEPSAEELYVRKASHALAVARAWRQAATDSGLDELLSPVGRRVIRELGEKVRQREILSADAPDAIIHLAELCSKTLPQRYGHVISPDARARILETNGSAEATLTKHSQQLFALAKAIDEVLDLEAALRRRQEILARG